MGKKTKKITMCYVYEFHEIYGLLFILLLLLFIYSNPRTNNNKTKQSNF